MYTEMFDRLVTNATKLRGMVPKTQMAALAKLLPAISEKAENAKGQELTQVRKALGTAWNLFASVRDGISNGEMSKKDYDGIIRELQGLQKQVAAAEAPKPVKESAESKAMRTELSDSGDGRLGTQTTDGAAVLQKYNKYRTLAPAKLSKKFTAVQLPLVAITDPMLRKDRLGKLCDDKFFDYPILLKQTLLGLSMDWIKSEYKLNSKPAIEEVLALLKDKTKRTYVQVGNSKVMHEVMWVWVTTDREFDVLLRAASGHFRVTGWDFPWQVKSK